MEKARLTLDRFLKAWKAKNYLKMYKFCQVTWKQSGTKTNIETRYNSLEIEDYKIGEFNQISEAMFEFNVSVKINGHWNNEAPVNVICEESAYRPDKNGVWGVNPVSMLKTVNPV